MQKVESRRFIALIVGLIFVRSGLYAQNSRDYKTHFTNNEIIAASTASRASYLSTDEKEIFTVLNLARMYPKKFLKFLKAHEGLEEGRQNQGNDFQMSLIKELQKQKPLQPLQPDNNMFELAQCWATEAGKQGVTGHFRKGCKGGYYAECCDYGSSEPQEIVLDLLIDEGVSSLGHRRICLSAHYSKMGASIQPHKAWGTNTVLDFTYGDPLVRK